jgi:hypothetical protein
MSMAASAPKPIVVDVRAASADVRTIDVLARLQLDACRCGCSLELQHASAELLDLIAFVGLGDVLRVEPRREPEEREQPLGVEEERELGDPSL